MTATKIWFPACLACQPFASPILILAGTIKTENQIGFSIQPSATGTASFRSDTSTLGSTDSPTACIILCVRFTCFVRVAPTLRHRRNTRYWRMVNPYQTGTCTLQDAPSFAWRANDLHNPEPI